jgi:hypothetical protein
MEMSNLLHGVPRLTEPQVKALGQKMETFWSDLSPAEQAHVNLALSRMADDTSEVSGHAVLTEYGLLLSLIASILL